MSSIFKRFVMRFFPIFKALICLAAFFIALPASGLLPLFSGCAHAQETVKTEASLTREITEDVNKAQYPPAPKLTAADYPRVKGFNARITVWIIAQLHLWFAAFILAVPVFVLIIEAMGMATGDKRYDNMAYEFIKISMSAYSITAIFGGLLTLSLIVFYPDLIKYMARLFSKSMLAYGFLFFAESACLYIYFYGWSWLQGGFKKWVHLTIGLMLNFVGTILMFLANAWVTFSMSPGGVDPATGAFLGKEWDVIHNFLWNPLNMHRVVANIAYGGSIIGAYAAYRFLNSSIKEEKAHYDWMGYTAILIAVAGLLPLPFAGYWLTAEIYAYSQQMGITLMGGAFAWIFIIQAVIIGALFLSVNYYLWCGMSRSEGSYRYTKHIWWIATILVVCFLVWFTPHTPVMTNQELKALGGPYHKYLGPLGIMPAKNTAVNIMILMTFLSFILYKRSNKIATVSWAATGSTVQAAIFVAAILNIMFLGIYHGYFTNTAYKVASSVPQVLSTAIVIVSVLVIDFMMFRGAKDVGPLRWGKVPDRSQYALLMLAISFTWLMGLMGYVRSGIRQHWHINSIMRDNSLDAFTPTIGVAAQIVTIATIIFMSIVVFIFWLSDISAKKSDQ